jgi:hypothetical protein
MIGRLITHIDSPEGIQESPLYMVHHRLLISGDLVWQKFV